jgi:hypothetical protein
MHVARIDSVSEDKLRQWPENEEAGNREKLAVGGIADGLRIRRRKYSGSVTMITIGFGRFSELVGTPVLGKDLAAILLVR